MTRRAAVAVLLALAAVGVSCGGEPSGPVAGTLSVTLTTPNSGADSAIVITIGSPAALTSATAGPGLRLFGQPLGGTSTRFALVGQLTQGAVILTVGVEDVRAVGQYSATIQGVAQANYQVRPLPGGYSLGVVR